MNEREFVQKVTAFQRKTFSINIVSFEQRILEKLDIPMPQTKAVKIKNDNGAIRSFFIQINNEQINGWRNVIGTLRKDPKEQTCSKAGHYRRI